MMSNDDVAIREMTPADIPAGLSLCRASRWNQTERDWRHFLSTAPGGARVAVEKGRVIGTVATMPYGPFTWISMVLVDPASRGRGVGTRLLKEGLAIVPEGVAARLDATPAGEALYRKLGFADEYRLARWFLNAGGTRPAGARRARPLAQGDWPAILEMDRHAFGASRAALLEHLARHAAEYAWVLEEAGALRGYLFGRHGAVREHLGPLVAESAESAQQLLQSCLAAYPDRAVFVDVPDDRAAWSAALLEFGFAVERPFLRMHRGMLKAPEQPALVYAICGPEFG